MIKAYIFILKYKIQKNPINLSKHTKEFYHLTQKEQTYILDKYFKKLDKNFNIDYYFGSQTSSYYTNNKEISFYTNPYFDKKIISLNITNLKLIDKFKIEEKQINTIIKYSLNILTKTQIDITTLYTYPDELPKKLSNNIEFMKYLINIDYKNIKYLTYNPKYPTQISSLIQASLEEANQHPFNIKNFTLTNNTIPNILLNNLDFILYITKNDINNIKYINEKIIDNLTPTNTEKLIESINNNKFTIETLKQNTPLFTTLTKNYKFIKILIKNNTNNIKYISWHNLTDTTKNKTIKLITNTLKENNTKINIDEYLFKDILIKNYYFMEYLINLNPKYIKYTEVYNEEDNNKLIDIYFQKIKNKKISFNINNFIKDKYLNPSLIKNEKMFKYLFQHDHNIIKYINFFDIDNPNNIVNYLIKEITKKDYEFNNDNFLVNNKYPFSLSNSIVFMKYVISKNFNNLSYINTTYIDNKTLKKIINYACRTLYYIKGDTNLNFDIEGYFKNNDLLNNDYFNECLKSLESLKK